MSTTPSSPAVPDRTAPGPLFFTATASAILLLILCSITLATGVSQQWFEVFHPEAEYAARLVHDAKALRAIIALDDLFIAAYMATSVLFGTALANGKIGPVHGLSMAGGVAGGVLDLEENHHILSMIRVAERAIAIPIGDILHRTDLSQLKWMLAHVAFAIAAVAVRGKDPLTRMFRVSLVALQLPVGALAWTVTDPSLQFATQWIRYVSFVSGFAMIAWLSRPSRGSGGLPHGDHGAYAEGG